MTTVVNALHSLSNATTAIVGNDGSVQNHYTSNAWGQNLHRFENKKNRYTFTGREEDRESGFMHYRARSYFPAIGRFMQRDPRSEYGEHYIYTSNNPVNRVDPLGRNDIEDLINYESDITENERNKAFSLASKDYDDKKFILDVEFEKDLSKLIDQDRKALAFGDEESGVNVGRTTAVVNPSSSINVGLSQRIQDGDATTSSFLVGTERDLFSLGGSEFKNTTGIAVNREERDGVDFGIKSKLEGKPELFGAELKVSLTSQFSDTQDSISRAKLKVDKENIQLSSFLELNLNANLQAREFVQETTLGAGVAATAPFTVNDDAQAFGKEFGIIIIPGVRAEKFSSRPLQSSAFIKLRINFNERIDLTIGGGSGRSGAIINQGATASFESGNLFGNNINPEFSKPDDMTFIILGFEF